MTAKSETEYFKPHAPILLKRPNEIQVAKVGIRDGDFIGLRALRYILGTFGLKHTFSPFISTEVAIFATKQDEIDGLWVLQTDKALEQCDTDINLRFENLCAFKLLCNERIYHFFVRC